jgi:hypothetical protein
MAKLRINGDSSGYVDLEAPNAASSSTIDLDQVPQKNVANTFSAVNNFTGNVGINRSTPQSKFEAWTNNGELSHFGSNNTNANNNYTGISLGYAESGANSNYRKVGIVAVGRGDGAARQDLAFLVDSNSDGNSVDLNDTKMRISHEGYVTTPNQPAFSIYGNTNPNWTSDVIYLGHTGSGAAAFDTNIGNHFSYTTGKFTAPVAGTYFFSFSATTNDANSHFIDIHKNGARVGGHVLSYGYQYLSATNTCILTLASGDYIEARRRAANYSLYSVNFSGYLIG